MSYYARWGGAIVAAALVSACSASDDVTRVDVEATGSVAGTLFLDTDGGGALDGGDPRLDARTVTLGTSAGGSIRDVVTDTAGGFSIEEVPVGTYVVGVPASLLGDTLVLESPTSVTVRQNEISTVDLGVSFPSFDIEAIGGVEGSRRIFTSGIALNERLPFGDGRVHLRGAQDALRMVDVDRVGLGTGDSVRVLGRTEVRQGRTVLADATVSVLIPRASVPAPIEVGTGVAATAEAGAIDADLVRIRDARILDTTTVAGDRVLTVDDGSGPVDVLLQAFQTYDLGALVPDPVVRIAEMTGLLVPQVIGSGAQVWRLVPRGPFDISTRTERVDVSVVTGLDFPVASRGDTVTYSVAVANAGPATATGVQLVDSLPPGFTLLEALPTRGVFDTATNRWNLGDLIAGAADTLDLRVRVSTELFGDFENRARLLPLASELDTNSGNDLSSAVVEVVEPEDKLADLRVRLETADTGVTVGQEFELVVSAVNAGPLTVSAVQIRDSLPVGIQLISATTSRGSRDGSSAVWSLDSIPLNGIETLRLRVRATDQAVGTVTVRAFSLGTRRENDPVPSNDSAEVTLTVAPAQESPLSDQVP